MYDWSYFDKIYCISTPEAYTRRTYFRYIARKLQMPFEFKIFKRHPEGSNHGCALSHYSLINEAYNNKFSRIIIMEDDIIIGNITPKILENIIHFLENKKKWDLFYFGAVPDARIDDFCSEKNKRFYSIKSLCTHSYALNYTAIKKYYNMKYIGIPLDYLFRDDNSTKSYAYLPTQFFQETSLRLPQFCINTYFRFVELYAYYIGISLKNPIYKLFLYLIISCIIYKNVYEKSYVLIK